MIYILLNILPIGLATLFGLALGWGYARLADVERLRASAVIVAALGMFWLASILAGALILAPDKASPWVMATASAVVIWAGFALPIVILTQQFRSMPLRSILGDCAFWLAAMLGQAVLMKLIGLVPPPA